MVAVSFKPEDYECNDHFGDRYMVVRHNAHPSDDYRQVFGRDRELAVRSESMRHSGPRVTHAHGISDIGKSALISQLAP
jgi:hypothetical protein